MSCRAPDPHKHRPATPLLGYARVLAQVTVIDDGAVAPADYPPSWSHAEHAGLGRASRRRAAPSRPGSHSTSSSSWTRAVLLCSLVHLTPGMPRTVTPGPLLAPARDVLARPKLSKPAVREENSAPRTAQGPGTRKEAVLCTPTEGGY